MEAANTDEIKACNIKKRLQEILDMSLDNDKLGNAFDIFMTTLICLNILALMFQTVDFTRQIIIAFFWWFEVFSVIVFTIEYLLRVWSCTVIPKHSHSIWGRVKFLFKPLMIVDLLAILPFYLPLIGIDLRFIRGLRLFRLFWILKLVRYLQSLQLFGKIIYKKKEQLLTTMFFLLVLLIFSSFAIFYVEGKAQPETFRNVFDAMWWGVITFTTIGYGDMYPKTELGRFIASISAIIGVMIFALPTSILTAAFIEENQRSKEENICPHCGQKFNDNRPE